MEESAPNNMDALGSFLRTEREKKQITIEQLASATKINIKLLHALESDNYESLPAKPFVRGFVTSYTRFIGLNSNEILGRFDSYLDTKTAVKFKHPENMPHVFVEKEKSIENHKTILTIIMASFLVVAIIAFTVLKPALKKKKSKHQEKPNIVSNEELYSVPPPPLALSPPTLVSKPQMSSPVAEIKPIPKPQVLTVHTPVNPPVASVAQLPKSSTPPVPNNEVRYRLIVRAISDSWVKYQSDDRPLQQYTLKKDQIIYIRARNSIRFRPGHPEGVEISYDNRRFVPFGKDRKTLIIPEQAEEQYKSQPFPSTDTP